MFSLKYFVVVIFILIEAYRSLLETVDLRIAAGNIRGLVNSTIRKNVTYYNFRGIPYALPPEGPLRFANPVKKSSWNGTLDATYDRSQCIQLADADYFGSTVVGQEDCLYINVYTPNYNATDLSVLVWIHGGAFIGGNSSYRSFGPDFFLEQDLVFVSFNYRLGIFGFLSTEDSACSGNWGIKDQILALKWVQENIVYFGGSSSKVTIFGESAGAVSVHLLMQTHLTERLFHRAIMNSGSTLNLWALNTRAAATAYLVATNLTIDTTNTTEQIEKLREIDAERLQIAGWVTALTLFLVNGLRGLPYGPTMELDIEGAVYIKPSDDALRAGNFRRVPVLMGFNSNEAAMVTDITSKKIESRNYNIHALLRLYLLNYDVAVDLLTPHSMTSNYTKRSSAGSDIKSYYFGSTAISASSGNLIEFISYDQFNRPIRRAASDMANYTTVYFYEFGYQGNISGLTERIFDGTGHAEDNQYLFRSYNNATATDQKVSETLVVLWCNFVKYGNPTPREDPSLNNTIWNPVNPLSSNFTYMSINASLGNSVNPKQSDWEFYTRLWDEYGDEPETTTY